MLDIIVVFFLLFDIFCIKMKEKKQIMDKLYDDNAESMNGADDLSEEEEVDEQQESMGNNDYTNGNGDDDDDNINGYSYSDGDGDDDNDDDGNGGSGDEQLENLQFDKDDMSNTKQIVASKHVSKGMPNVELQNDLVMKRVTTQQMVKTAIEKLNERNGSSLPAILKFIKNNYTVLDEKRTSNYVKQFIKKALISNELMMIKRSYKLNKKIETKRKSIEKMNTKKVKKSQEKVKEKTSKAAVKAVKKVKDTENEMAKENMGEEKEVQKKAVKAVKEKKEVKVKKAKETNKESKKIPKLDEIVAAVAADEKKIKAMLATANPKQAVALKTKGKSKSKGKDSAKDKVGNGKENFTAKTKPRKSIGIEMKAVRKPKRKSLKANPNTNAAGMRPNGKKRPTTKIVDAVGAGSSAQAPSNKRKLDKKKI